MKHVLLSTPLLLATLAAPAAAQWSTDPDANLSVADGGSDQAQPKLAPTADGGCYVSWFDGISTGYDVRLQKLDANGLEEWPHNGVLVADRSFSSTQDYALDAHASGDALIAFRDDRTGSTQITAQRVGTDGTLLWGAGFGVQLTTSGFLTAPKIAGTADGHAVVAWMQDGVTRVQRLDATGASVWATSVDMPPPAGFYTPSDMHAAGDDVILSIVHQTGTSFSAPKHLVAQKLDASGALLWGAAPVPVFDGGSLQIGNFPSFVPDGLGGAVFAWYGTSPLQCYAQRILSNGSEAFPHNGVPGSTNVANVRVSPTVAFDASSSSTTMFWKEQNAGQSMAGLHGQRFDAAGNPQWGAAGKVLVPVSSTQIEWIRTLPTATGHYVAWIASPSFGQEIGRAAVVDVDGDFVVSPLDFASTASPKTRLAAALATTGDAILAWTDDLVDDGDVLAQNLRPDGSLGAGGVRPYCFGSGCPCLNDDPAAGCANGSGSGALLSGGGSPTVGADSFVLTATNAVPGQPGVFFQGVNAVGGGAGAPFGDGLRCAGGALIRLVTVVPDGSGCAASDGSCGTVGAGTAGAISTHPAQSGPGAVAPGETRYYQYWYRDPSAGPCGSTFNLSNGVEVVWG